MAAIWLLTSEPTEMPSGLPVGDVGDVDVDVNAYDAVVLGSAIYVGAAGSSRRGSSCAPNQGACQGSRVVLLQRPDRRSDRARQ
jgi:hypothetical protein